MSQRDTRKEKKEEKKEKNGAHACPDLVIWTAVVTLVGCSAFGVEVSRRAGTLQPLQPQPAQPRASVLELHHAWLCTQLFMHAWTARSVSVLLRSPFATMRVTAGLP